MLEFIVQPLRVFLDGVLGKDRKAKQKLTKRLAAERAAYSQLLQNQNDLERDRQQIAADRDRLTANYSQLENQYKQLQTNQSQLQKSCAQLDQARASLLAERATAKKQIEAVSQSNREIALEKAALSLKIEELKTDIKYLKKNNAEYVDMANEDVKKYEQALKQKRDRINQLLREKASLRAKLNICIHQKSSEARDTDSDSNTDKAALNDIPSEILDSLDLSDTSIAVVGGHDNLHSYLTDKLQRKHGIRKNKIRTINDDHGWDHGNVKERVQNFDYIFVVTEHMSHKLSGSVMDLRSKHSLSGEVIRLDTKGTTTVLKSILSHIAHTK